MKQQKYLSEFNNLDLAIDQTPPKELFLEMKMLKDYGTVIILESRLISIKKGTTHYVTNQRFNLC